MPTKLGKGGKGLEDFDPETGEYTAGASISKRGDSYWVHGDLRSRKITKEEYDDFKTAGYKEDFDADTKHYKLYKDWIGFKKEPTMYDSEGTEFNLDLNKLYDLFADTSLTEDQLKYEVGKLLIPNNPDFYLGTMILRDYLDDYKRIRGEAFEKIFEQKSKKADEYLSTFQRFEPGNIATSSHLSNSRNYEISQKFKYNQEKYDMYTSNCQRCVMAWYLRFKGYNVEASPFESEGNKILRKNRPTIKIKTDFGAMMRQNWSYSGFNIPEDTYFDYAGKDGEWQSTQYKRIKDMVSKMPNQSVCFCSVKWRGCNEAHVFIVHNDNGYVSFIDPQDDSDASEYFDKSKHTIEARWTTLLRINDFSLNGEVLPYIVRKEGTAKNEYEEWQSQYKSI